tara:strand:- start:443 stop:703 length:261 start_codon:yes stop_codon:yes gene_type:complete
MKKLRNVKPGTRKKIRRDASSELAQKAAAFLNHPTECCLCQTDFKRTKKTVKTWHVTVNESRARLTCPSCWGKLNKALDGLKNEKA